jgi:predicted CoA-substrate-specific enzyme activase
MKKMVNAGQLIIGIDVGSTTVKGIVVDTRSRETLWSDYQRHDTRQAEKVFEFLHAIQQDFSSIGEHAQLFMTGSGAANLAPLVGAKFVQEVNAVSLAVENYHDDVGSVVELGGQDAKIIVWRTDAATGLRQKVLSMNDKCAGGTGAVIDKICAKLRLDGRQLQELSYQGIKLHPVAGKCGVFAETDINGLQKQGVAANELMASLFAAIVQQNLSVLTRGNTLLPKVLLLGGPNTFIPALRDAWRASIPDVWRERGVALGDVEDPEELVIVPKNAELYAALGCVLYGLEEPNNIGVFQGTAELERFIAGGRTQKLQSGTSDTGLFGSRDELATFLACQQANRPPPSMSRDQSVVHAWLGLDGGSTSTKGVLIDRDGRLLAEAYQLSQGNPIADVKQIIARLSAQIEEAGSRLDIKGVGTTGYAKDILKDVLAADVALVETVAHTRAALHYYADVDVIVDVGGQDIKIIFVKNGVVRDFKLNTQCSAGNGYFLQNTAERFGIAVEDYADEAFKAELTPVFSYGCAVFLESDIVNFQRLGWQRHEIMAGLAKVLPKNIWLYVAQEPNLRKFGTRFILQGGTQKNLAAVKAQIDYIEQRVPEAEVRVHKHCSTSGAIGCALEALKLTAQGDTGFIGTGEVAGLTYTTTRNEDTRCFFCKNKCLRTFVNTLTASGRKSMFIIATCEKGATTDVGELKAINARQKKKDRNYPNLVASGAKQLFRSFSPPIVARPDRRGFKAVIRMPLPGRRGQEIFSDVFARREKLRIGMPRVLNMYSTAPFFRAYFESLGVKKVIWSDFTSEAMYKEGSKRGAIDPCFPSKVTIAHIHNLLVDKNIDILFFPTMISLKEQLSHTLGSRACPSVQSSANVCRAAFTKEADTFRKHDVTYIDDALHMNEPNLLVKQMYNVFAPVLGLGVEENALAVEQGWEALESYQDRQRERGHEVLKRLTEQDEVGMLMIGRPYHLDPGLNHEIVDEIQKNGFPILHADSLPDGEEDLAPLFAADIAAGRIRHAKDITDVFGNPYSANTNMKIWAAKYAARHPNLAVIDLSNFKCGMDAPIYDVIEGILEATQTPYFTFHDIDENRPAGSIKIRVETIVYALRQYQARLKNRANLKTLGDVDAEPVVPATVAKVIPIAREPAARRIQ